MTNSPVRPMPSRPMLPRARQSVLTLALLASLFNGAANAQVFVTDKASITSNQTGFKSQLAQTAQQYVRQGLEYQKQIQQYEQILTSIPGLATSGIQLTGGRLQEITNPSNLIRQSCPGATGGGILGSMTSIVTSSFSQSITTTQQNICKQIVLAQIHKYNATVKVVNDTQQFGQELQEMTSKLGSMTSQGDSERMAANAAAHNDKIASEMVDWQSQTASDDAVIATLQQQQGILAKVALNGSNSILGNMVQAAAFAKAFD